MWQFAVNQTGFTGLLVRQTEAMKGLDPAFRLRKNPREGGNDTIRYVLEFSQACSQG